MSTSFFGSSLFTRRSRSLNKGREVDKLPFAADDFPPASGAGRGPVGGKSNGRLAKAAVLQGRHSHQTQTSFLPELDEDSAADSCDRAIESFLPFGESETLVPRKASIASSATNTDCAHALAHERRQAAVALVSAPRSRPAARQQPRRNTDPSRSSSSSIWNTATHSASPRPFSVDGRRSSTDARDPGPIVYYGPRDEAQPGHWAQARSDAGDAQHPVVAAPSGETVHYSSGHEWRDTILEESSDDSESPLAPLDALEGFCDGEVTSEDERRLASAVVPPPARASAHGRPSSLLPRTSSQFAPRQSQVMRPLASRIRKLSGASRSSRSSVGSPKVNRATQVDSQSSPASVPIQLGPLPPLPESSRERSIGNDQPQRSPPSDNSRRWLAEYEAPVTNVSALGLSLAAACLPGDQTASGVSYIMPPEERSRITTEADEADLPSQCSSPSSSPSAHSEHSLDTLLVPSSPGVAAITPSPMPASPFLCPATPAGLYPPPRRKTAPASSSSSV